MRARVGRLLRRESPTGPKRVAVQGVATERAGRWRLALRTETDGEVGRRSIDAPSCNELADAFTLISALVIDPQAAGEHGAALGLAPPPAEEGVAPIALSESKAPAAAPAALWAGLGLRSSLGLLPGAGLGGGGAVAVRAGRERIEVGVDVWPARGAVVEPGPPEAGVKVGLVTAGLTVCHDLVGRRLTLEGCGGADVGPMRGRAFGAPGGGTERAWWLGLRAGPALRWAVGPRLALRGLVEGVVPIARPAFSSGDALAHRPARLGGQALLAAELRLF